uniref:NodB protein n=1 Tax=Rhizobium gallicum bv. phaseoli TaxID=142628 RepID=Q712A0_9HYPH|nr:NodB protein [Rhizobium gallicum bv. phaseoli]
MKEHGPIAEVIRRETVAAQ